VPPVSSPLYAFLCHDYSGDLSAGEKRHSSLVGENHMSKKMDRDLEKDYPIHEFVSKLRHLADALESGAKFEIQIAGERIYVPTRAKFNIEHEREGSEEEIEFQIKWTNK
jgi:amphi-Trp domain-containing protein